MPGGSVKGKGKDNMD